MPRLFVTPSSSPARCTGTSASAHRALLAALLLLAPATAQACTAPPPGTPDLPITVLSDGSFQNAETAESFGTFSGRPVRDIGGGRVGQVLISAACEIDQELLFVDCTAGSAVVVYGKLVSPGREGLVTFSTRALQPPYGPLALTPSTTVAEVLAIAQAEGWGVETDVPAYAAERGPQNAFDPFMGCEIFYPGSVGAAR